MHKSTITVDCQGFIIAKNEYDGPSACYLVNNEKIIEKVYYKHRNECKFKEKPKYGVLSVIFFFKDKSGEITQFKTERLIYDDESNTLSRITPKIIFNDVISKIDYYDQGSDITFITFNGAGTTKQSIPFGQTYILKNKWNLISVSQDGDSQYQGIDIEDFYENVAPLIIEKKVFVYGSSLGGYCALYFGGCIDATIIAASPRNSAHPSINSPKFSNLVYKHRDFSEVPATTKSVYIVYDSNIVMDKRFIYEQVMKLYPEPKLLALPDGSHAVLKTMLSSKVLQLYISSIICNCYNKDIEKYIVYKCSK